MGTNWRNNTQFIMTATVGQLIRLKQRQLHISDRGLRRCCRTTMTVVTISSIAFLLLSVWAVLTSVDTISANLTQMLMNLGTERKDPAERTVVQTTKRERFPFPCNQTIGKILIFRANFQNREYIPARDSLRCYAKLAGYEVLTINMDTDAVTKRHCSYAHVCTIGHTKWKLPTVCNRIL